MRVRHYSREKLEGQVKAIVGKYLDLAEYKLFFFGSRVTGKGDERSDIDIGILGSNKVPLSIMAKIEEEIEDKIITLYSIDIVDFFGVSDEFRQVAEQKIEEFR